jgi:hypothetical protein
MIESPSFPSPVTAATVIRQTLDSHMAHPAIECLSQYKSSPLMPLRPLIHTLHINGSSSSPRSVPVLDSLFLQLFDNLKPHMTLACTHYRQPHGQRQESLNVAPPPAFQVPNITPTDAPSPPPPNATIQTRTFVTDPLMALAGR